MDGIQSEFPQSIYAQNPPINTLPVQLWSAMDGDIVVGTVGIVLLAGKNAVLKSMMVRKEYRGAAVGLSARLMDMALQYADSNGARHIFLGTMTQFKAAHQFYRKNAFKQIGRQDLPADFVINPVDDVFFVRTLNNPAL